MLTALTAATLFLATAPPPPPPPNYAILVSGHVSLRNDQDLETDFINDLVTQYAMLRELGFAKSNIFVFYGAAKGCSRLQGDILTNCADATQKNIADRLSAIGQAAPDYLYVWWMSHGQFEGDKRDCNTTLVLEGPKSPKDYKFVSKSELYSLIESAKARRVDLFVAACYGEGIINAFSDKKVTVTTNSQCGVESSNISSAVTCDKLSHDEFSYWQRAAILADAKCERLPYPTLRENRLSLAAIREYAADFMESSSPQISDPKAALTSYLDRLGPVRPQQILLDLDFPFFLRSRFPWSDADAAPGPP